MARTTEGVLYGLTHADLVANIAAVLDLATAQDWADGVAWYRKARRAGGVLGRASGYKGKRAYSVGAGVLAALSPSCEWDVNVRCAFAVAANGGRRDGADDSRHQSAANVAKAAAILSGGVPLDVLGGAKVRAFFACILDPSDPWAVCIDRHAAAVAYGRTLSDREMKNAVAVTKGADRYQALADAYRAVAAARGMLPMDVQAVTWVTWRRLKGGARAFTVSDATAVAL